MLADIDQAVAGYQVALKKHADAEAMLTNLEKQEKSARAMLEAGEISRSELASVRLQLSALALARADALAQSQQALGQLEDALQGPLGLPVSAWQSSPRVTGTDSSKKSR